MNDPRVAVEHPSVMLEGRSMGRSRRSDTIVVDSLLHVTCSACGEVTDFCSPDERIRLQRIARAHSDEVHDGLVDAVGWVR